MGILDIIFIIPIVWLAYKGFSKGLIIELATLAALALGIYVSLHFSYLTADFLSDHFEMTQKYLGILSFIITFILVVIAINLIGKLLEKVIDLVALSFLNKSFGGFFGVLKAAIFLSFIIYFINNFDKNKFVFNESLTTKSVLYPYIEDVAPAIIKFYNGINEDDGVLDKVKNKAEETVDQVIN
ncbi:MAG: CvpA family protein [Bacteroidales bacterium]|nr:CvpA family protein [Bacteroidales bacterium]